MSQPAASKKGGWGVSLLRGSDTSSLDEAFHCGSGLSTFGDPGINLRKVQDGITLFQGGIVAAKDFQEAAIALETLISGDNAINVAPVGTFLTETKNNSHDL
jgi:hypothetical protein